MRFFICFSAFLLATSISVFPGSGDSLRVRFFARLHLAPSDQSEIVLFVEDGKQMTIKERRGDWVLVQSGDTAGWMKTGATVSKSPYTAIQEKKETHAELPSLAIVLSAIPALLLVFLFWRRQRRKTRPARSPVSSTDPHGLLSTGSTMKDADCPKAILICRRSKNIPCAVSSVYKPLSSWIKSAGFATTQTDRLVIENGISPALVVVDYTMGHRILLRIERFYIANAIPFSVPLIVYNIPDPSKIIPSTVFENSFYFGTGFSSSDLINSIATFARTSTKTHKKLVPELQGEIRNENLSEVLQLMELSTKTGVITIFNRAERSAGILSLDKGIIVFARMGSCNGDRALISILDVRDGYFKYFPHRISNNANCNIAPTQAILHLAKDRDEELARSSVLDSIVFGE